MFHRCCECPALRAERDMYVSQEVRQAARSVGSQNRERFAHGILPNPGADLLTGSLERALPRFCGTIGPQTASWRGTFSRTALRRAVALFGEQAGRWWRSTTLGNLKATVHAEQCRETCCQGRLRSRWRRLMQLPWRGFITIGPAFVAHRLRRYRRDNQWAKAQSFGSPRPRAHVWNRLLVSHDEVRAVKVKVHSTQGATWRLGALPILFKRGKRLCRHTLQRKEQTHTSLLFGWPRVLLLAPLWPSKRRVGLLRPTSCSGSGVGTTPGLLSHDHGGTATACETQAQEEERRLLRRFQVTFPTGFLPFFPRAFSQDSHLHPRSFRGHSVQLGRVCNHGGRTEPSSSAPNVWGSVLGTGGRTCVAAAAGAFLEGAHRSLRKLRSWAVFEQTLSLAWTVEARAATFPGRANHAGGAVGIVRGGFGSNCDGANRTHKSNVLPRRQRYWHTGSALPRRPQQRT